MLYLKKNKVPVLVCQLGEIVGEESNGSIKHVTYREIDSVSGDTKAEGKARIMNELLQVLDVDDNNVPTNARLSRNGDWIVAKGVGLSKEGFGKKI